MTIIEKNKLIQALIKGGYNLVDAINATNGSNADNLYREYCGDNRIVLSDLFIGNFKVSQVFGARPEVYKQFGLKGHDGLDFSCPTGTQLISPFDGLIISVKNSGKAGYGLHVKIWNKKNACVLYGHMKSVNVKLWQTVKCGQLIGISDNTGFSTGSHLHLGLCKTNLLGYRLNTNNGFAGWINPQDKNEVKWDIKNPTKPL